MRTKMVGDERVELTAAEETQRDAEDAEFARAPTQAEIDAEIDALTDRILLNDRMTKALGEMLFQVAKAAKTGDFTYFSTVTNKADFIALFKTIVKAG